MSDPATSSVKSENSKADDGRVVIKKYANRRLYNTQSSSYVTLEHLSEMVKKGVDFVVFDAKTNEEITRSVLTQIIFEEESRGQNLLPIQFLRQLIRFYGDSMQALVPSYLEMSLNSFTEQQERMRQQFSNTLGGSKGLAYFEDQVRQNMQLFDRAMKMFSPMPFPFPGATTPESPAPAPAASAATPAGDESLADLKQRIEAMQAQIAKLAAKG
jgi:polyhydroxyalkanoate synthesis repressor PhaR